MSSMKNDCEILDWDSNFFGFKVCKVNRVIEVEADINDLFNFMKSHQTSLAYYASKNEIDSRLAATALFEISLVDKKTTFVKRINNHAVVHPSITAYEKAIPEKKLLDLAIQSGQYSRFNMDNRIEKKKLEELYGQWIINSVNKKIAKEVMVFMESGQIAGFVTLGVKNERADIGIIAVDHQYRGKGVGQMLMSAAENWFYTHGFSTVQVVTQGENYPACRLYERCGYQVESVNFFYHLWRNNF